MLAPMLRPVVIAVALLAGAGCRDEALEQMRALKLEVCACKDVACGEAAMKKIPQGNVPSDHRTQAVARQLLDCMAKLYAKDQPVTDPDAEAEPAGSATTPGSADPASARTP